MSRYVLFIFKKQVRYEITACPRRTGSVKSVENNTERNNYSVDAIYDGQKALYYLQTDNYDAVILDIIMPKVDEITVLRKIRKEGNLIPVLMLTAKSEVDDKILVLDTGSNDYLTKPFNSRELLARIRAMTRTQNFQATSRLKLGNVALDCATYELSTASGSFRLANKVFQMMEMMMSSLILLLIFLLQLMQEIL